LICQRPNPGCSSTCPFPRCGSQLGKEKPRWSDGAFRKKGVGGERQGCPPFSVTTLQKIVRSGLSQRGVATWVASLVKNSFCRIALHERQKQQGSQSRLSPVASAPALAARDHTLTPSTPTMNSRWRCSRQTAPEACHDWRARPPSHDLVRSLKKVGNTNLIASTRPLATARRRAQNLQGSVDHRNG
jgi:hypothetical protein